MTTSVAARRLDRLLAGLAEDLTVATDVEIREACEELGIDPSMKGSSAFAGLRHFDALREFCRPFDWAVEQHPAGTGAPMAPKAKRPRAKSSGRSRGRTGAGHDDD